ncbi:MAG: nicotinate-nucleotide adenylyltransferase [Clostridiales bacterium]|jgi:nicotinate-nucleotide adenylyltransferase|nr:nicotinate-nucleotide adenylyltransferase [Clostridiales bacterium]
MKKVGIMGGTFNPIHNGHLFLAEHAYEQAGLDYVLFMPTMNPPHKADMTIIPAEHRINMVREAVKDNPHFIISDFELNRPGITYTSDTLKALKENEPDTEYYFIVGGDSLMMMAHWMDPKTVFGLSTIIAGGREQCSQEQLEEQVKYLENEFGGRIILLDMPLIELSSEKVRERVAKGKSIIYYVPDEVARYIREHNLYI